MKIEIKHRLTGAVLFAHKCKNNNIRITLEAAIKAKANLREASLHAANLRGANLRGANLRGADLRGADLRAASLRGANLRGADLRWTDLREASLREADLRWADLRWADLCGANLREADLREADLREATGNTREVISFQCFPYYGVYTAESMQIGCYKYPVATFFKDSEKRKAEFSESDIEWRNRNKHWIQAMVKANPAVPTGHEGDRP